MKITLSWLKEHLLFDGALDTLEEQQKLINAFIKMGVEVENIEDYNNKYAQFSIAYIKSAEKHPNADKLKVCKVDTKDGELQIVCGAENARAGIYVVYAPVGSYVMGVDLTLKQANIRGIDSCGMMLSERELCISNEHNGIVEFNEGVIGGKVSEALGINDVVIELSITPNRGDLLGVRGIAKDLVACGFGVLKPLEYQPTISKEKTEINITINKELSSQYSIRKILNVKNEPSPKWLQQRLKLIGQESRGALVDITNYICFTLNQPLHCFDLDKIHNARAVSVTTNSQNTLFKALDEKQYELNSSIPLVVFGDQIGAIAGIKGSLDTCCDDKTHNILLEGAHFNHKIIALAKRFLDINTESAYRFERGIDTKSIEEAIEYATYMICSICGGDVYGITTVNKAEEKLPIEFDLDYVNNLSGLSLSVQDVEEILVRLNFTVKFANQRFMVVPPSSRNDIDDKSAIVGELVRAYGVDLLPLVSLPCNNTNTKAYTDKYGRNIFAKKILSQKLLETVNMSFISAKLADLFTINDERLSLCNPISEELKVMRKSLIPSLMIVLQENINKMQSNINIFESANVYIDDTEQEICLAGLVYGNKLNKNWLHDKDPYNIWDIKCIVFDLLDSFGFNTNSFVLSPEGFPSYYHPNIATSIIFRQSSTIGYFGCIHPRILKELGMKKDVFVFEIFLDRLPVEKKKLHKLAVYDIMPVTRDFVFIVDENVVSSNIMNVVQSVDRKTITDITVFDLYIGANVATGKKSLGITVNLQAQIKTFTEIEIQNISDQIVRVVCNKFQAKLRDF